MTADDLSIETLTGIGMLPVNYQMVLDGVLGPLTVLAMNDRHFRWWLSQRRPLARCEILSPVSGLRGRQLQPVIALEGWWLHMTPTSCEHTMWELIGRGAEVFWDYT